MIKEGVYYLLNQDKLFTIKDFGDLFLINNYNWVYRESIQQALNKNLIEYIGEL